MDMQPTREQLQARVRAGRARLDRHLADLGERVGDAAATTARAGRITMFVVIASATVGTIAILLGRAIARLRARY